MKKQTEPRTGIKIVVPKGVMYLHYIAGSWRDSAGHKWEMNKDGVLFNQKHGSFSLQSWSTVGG